MQLNRVPVFTPDRFTTFLRDRLQSPGCAAVELTMSWADPRDYHLFGLVGPMTSEQTPGETVALMLRGLIWETMRTLE
jgi:hypothetical protein